LFEAAALVTALALNRYYNLLGSLTTRQAAVLWVPLAICLASGAYVALRFQRARSSDPRLLAFAIAMNLVAVILVFVGSELAVRAFSESTFAGVSFSGTLLLPKDWEDVKARHLEILAQVPPELSHLVADDFLGWAPGRSRRSSNGLYSSSVEGIRSSEAGISLASRAVGQRVAIVGDSFTFGLEVLFEDSWGAVLERTPGSNLAVLNLGVDGYGVDQALLRYERDGRGWKPAVAILGFIEHDLHRTLSVYPFVTFPEWGLPFAKPRFVLKNGGLERLTDRLASPTLIMTEPAIDDLPFIAHDPGFKPDEWDHHWYHASYAVRFLLSRFRRWPSLNQETYYGELERLNVALVSRFINVAKADGTIPLIVFFPARNDFTQGDHPARDPVLAALRRAGVEYTDLTSCVGALGEKAFIPGRPHYSAAGNAAVATCLLPVVRQALMREQDETRTTAGRRLD